jgi:hypothetical protein
MIYPFLGYLPDRIDYPFYRMTFSQGKAMNKSQWASIVLDKKKASIEEVWRQLFYYNFTKRFYRVIVKKILEDLKNSFTKCIMK